GAAGCFATSPKSLCDNPEQALFRMRLYRHCALWMGLVLAAAVALPKPGPQLPTSATASVPLVLTGSTLIDVTDWGHSACDLQNAVVIVRDGRISEVGASGAVAIPKGDRGIHCTGKFII